MTFQGRTVTHSVSFEDLKPIQHLAPPRASCITLTANPITGDYEQNWRDELIESVRIHWKQRLYKEE